MAQQSNHNVVGKSLSGGDPSSPSDVPMSTSDKISAGGDADTIGNTTEKGEETDQQQEDSAGGEMTHTIEGGGGDGKEKPSLTNVSIATIEKDGGKEGLS